MAFQPFFAIFERSNSKKVQSPHANYIPIERYQVVTIPKIVEKLIESRFWKLCGTNIAIKLLKMTSIGLFRHFLRFSNALTRKK